MINNRVFVISIDGIPLMPCKAVIARLLLKQRKARVVHRTPFTIQLLYKSTTYTQRMYLGIDTGAKTIGTAVVGKHGKSLYCSEIIVRNEIRKKMDTRRMYRRTRRNRKLRYRMCRFLNRKNSIKSNRYSPTMKSKFNSHCKEIAFISKLLPIRKTHIICEISQFDTQLMQNPKLRYQKWGYQRGPMYGYANVREYILLRDKYTCKQCGDKNVELHVHHIKQRAHGGSNSPNNLVTLCKTCHNDYHKNLIKLKNFKLNNNFNLKYATQMSVIRSMLLKQFNDIKETFGFITKVKRQILNLKKSHFFDAIAIASGNLYKQIKLTNQLLIKRCVSKGRYQQTWGIRSEKSYPKSKVFGFKTWDKIIYQNINCFIKGTMSTGYYMLSDIFGNKINFKPMAKSNTMKRLSARKSWIMTEVTIPNI